MKRSKIDITNQSVVNEDRISELPEALILHILSLLPTRFVITTSVLSKQWQSHWKMLPKLNFNCVRSYFCNHKPLYSEKVCKALLTHKAPVLQSLHLVVRLDIYNAKDIIKILIGLVFSRNVRELVLHVQHGERFIFPNSFYNSETLETLKLKNWVLMDVPSSVCLKSLRTLELIIVDFKDNESLLNLLSGCPNLENLVVHPNQYGSVKTFTITVPSLQRLSLCNHNTNAWVDYVINAPSLKYLGIEWFRSPMSCLIENAPELVEANISIRVDTIHEKILGSSLTSVKRLSLKMSSALEKLFRTGSIFYQLVYLELCTYRGDWSNLLTFMLDTSPNLQVLKLIGPQKLSKKCLNTVPLGKWNQPKNVPECLLLSLQTFVCEDYYKCRETEKKVTKYILKNEIYSNETYIQ